MSNEGNHNYSSERGLLAAAPYASPCVLLIALISDHLLRRTVGITYLDLLFVFTIQIIYPENIYTVYISYLVTIGRTQFMRHIYQIFSKTLEIGISCLFAGERSKTN